MDGETETEVYKYAVSRKVYWGKKKIFEAYSTKYRREGMKSSQKNGAVAYALSRRDSMEMLLGIRSKGIDSESPYVG